MTRRQVFRQVLITVLLALGGGLGILLVFSAVDPDAMPLVGFVLIALAALAPAFLYGLRNARQVRLVKDGSGRVAKAYFPRRQLLLGSLLALALLGYNAITLMNDAGLVEEHPWLPWAIGAPSLVLAMLSIPFLWRMRTTRTSRVAYREGTLALSDSRPPVVYLRSFANDESSTRLERDLIAAYRDHGLLIAIGAPENWAPPRGVVRFYVPASEDWQAAAQAMIDRAALIVIAASRGTGLFWEVGEVVRRKHPGQIVLVPPDEERRVLVTLGFIPAKPAQEAWGAFRQSAGSLFPKALPQSVEPGECVVFDGAWNARVERDLGNITPGLALETAGERGSAANGGSSSRSGAAS